MAGHTHETQEGREGEEPAPSPRCTWCGVPSPTTGVLRDVHRPHRSLWSPGACVLAQEEHVLGTFFCKLLDACLVPCSGVSCSGGRARDLPVFLFTGQQVGSPKCSLLPGRHLPQGWVSSLEALGSGCPPTKDTVLFPVCNEDSLMRASARPWTLVQVPAAPGI